MFTSGLSSKRSDRVDGQLVLPEKRRGKHVTWISTVVGGLA